MRPTVHVYWFSCSAKWCLALQAIEGFYDTHIIYLYNSVYIDVSVYDTNHLWFSWSLVPFDYMGLSENRVYSQWNSHLIGIMISKTIGFRGTRHFQTHPYDNLKPGQLRQRQSQAILLRRPVLLCAQGIFGSNGKNSRAERHELTSLPSGELT